MPFLYSSFNQELSQIQQDFSNQQLQLLAKNVLDIIATAQAGLSYEQIEAIQYYALQATPFTSSQENITRWATLKGCYRKQPTYAYGSIAFTGVAGSVVPQGEIISRQDGFTYATDAQYTIGNTTTVNAVATTLGSSGNAPLASTMLTLSNVVLGVNSNVALTTAITGGADIETDDQYRTRMLQIYASPPAGGNLQDYITWTESVPGVTRAWCDPNGAGAGTVIVYAMFDDENATSNATTSGFPIGNSGVATLETRGTPATQQLLSIVNYIYPLRPVTSLVYAVAPTPYSINITTSGLTVNTNLQTQIASALATLYLQVGTPLGGTISPSQIYGAINSVAPTQNFEVLVPEYVVVIPEGSLPVVGNSIYS